MRSSLVAAASVLAGGALSLGAAAPVSAIHEYPHARVAVHAHPNSHDDMSLALVRGALAGGVHEQELDLHLRGDDVVCDHDAAQASSPTLRSVLDAIVAWRGTHATVQNDGRQFIVVLEPKDDDPRLYDAIGALLPDYAASLSTSATATSGPRGITLVVTGQHDARMYDHLGAAALDPYAIVEGHDYDGEIVNLAPGAPPFMWVQSLKVDGGSIQGQIDDAHRRGFNARAYYGDSSADAMRLGLGSGADSLNCDFTQIDVCKGVLASQQPRGHWPTLASSRGQLLLTWRGNASDSIWAALGAASGGRLVFERQIDLTSFLADEPRALAPASAIAPDGRLVAVYEGTSARRLFMVSGAFTSLDRFVTFDGGERRITPADDSSRRGRHPTIAFGPDGRMLVAYEGTDSPNLAYLSGALDASGAYVAVERRVTRADGSRRGTTPSLAIDGHGRAILVYEGTSDARLDYVGGALGASGELPDTEYRLTASDDSRRGHTPSVALRDDGLVVVAYQGTKDAKIFFTTGTLAPDGSIASPREAQLVDVNGVAVRGSHPTAAFDASGDLTILYEGTDGGKLFYVSGPLDVANGRLRGVERLLDMSLGDGL